MEQYVGLRELIREVEAAGFGSRGGEVSRPVTLAGPEGTMRRRTKRRRSDLRFGRRNSECRQSIRKDC